MPFERHFVGDAADRARAAAELWPMGSIPVLVDDARLVLPESSAIVEHLDGVGDAPPLVPAGRAAALQARLWDRIVDGHVMTPMQKIVGDEPAARRAAATRRACGSPARSWSASTRCSTTTSRAAGRGWPGEAFTLADCAAAPALHYARVVHRWDARRLPGADALLRGARRRGRPWRA